MTVHGDRIKVNNQAELKVIFDNFIKEHTANLNDMHFAYAMAIRHIIVNVYGFSKTKVEFNNKGEFTFKGMEGFKIREKDNTKWLISILDGYGIRTKNAEKSITWIAR